jgi:hypothetical protein
MQQMVLNFEDIYKLGNMGEKYSDPYGGLYGSSPAAGVDIGHIQNLTDHHSSYVLALCRA